jgi:hypothetical protein
LEVYIYVFKLPPYTLAGFDLTTHSASLLGGRQRRYHYVDKANFKLLSTEQMPVADVYVDQNLSFTGSK